MNLDSLILGNKQKKIIQDKRVYKGNKYMKWGDRTIIISHWFNILYQNEQKEKKKSKKAWLGREVELGKS